jgi:hypothetical protein
MKREIRDTQGKTWQVSEGYAWAPMRQAAPSPFLVFRDGAGTELRADDLPPLAALAELAEEWLRERLAALLERARSADGARVRPLVVHRYAPERFHPGRARLAS